MSFAQLGDGDYATYAPKSKKPRLADSTGATAVAVATMTRRGTKPRTARGVKAIMNALDMEEVKRHFDQEADDIDPYEVCDGVSVETFNAYVGGGEQLRVALQFLELSDDGRILIVELPTTVHESTANEFARYFLIASGNGLDVAIRGSMTASRDALPNKEADATFGPKGDTPHQDDPPPPRTIEDWVTLAVEVGRSQTWASLTTAARWWAEYPGIQYVLLLKVSAAATQIGFRLYDINPHMNHPIAPTTSGTFRRRATPNAPPVNVEFDMHRILSIPAGLPLPHGVNPIAVVNLRDVMREVIRSLR